MEAAAVTIHPYFSQELRLCWTDPEQCPGADLLLLHHDGATSRAHDISRAQPPDPQTLGLCRLVGGRTGRAASGSTSADGPSCRRAGLGPSGPDPNRRRISSPRAGSARTRSSATERARSWISRYPGDFLGLRSILLRTSDHSFEPIVDIQAAEVLKSTFLAAFSQTPRLATAILWAASRDEAMVVEHLVGIGRRDADARMAHFLLELGSRLSQWSGLAAGKDTIVR
jgi:hypothetical protein